MARRIDTLFARLFGAMVLVAVVPLVSLWFVEYRQRRADDEVVAREALEGQGRAIAQNFADNVRGPVVRDLGLIARSPLIERYLLASESIKLLALADLEKAMLEVTRFTAAVHAIEFVDELGIRQAQIRGGRRSRDQLDLAAPARADAGGLERRHHERKRRLLSRLRQSGFLAAVAEPTVQGDPDPTILVGVARVHPVTGGFGAAIIIEYRLASFLDDLAQLTFHGARHAWAWSRDGDDLLRPDAELRADPRQAPAGPGLATTDAGAFMVVTGEISAGEVLLHVGLGVPKAVFEKFVRRTARRYAVSLVVILTLVVGAAALLSRLLSRPLSQLAGVSGRVARGDLNARVHLRGGKEVEQVGDAFNQMITALQRSSDQLRAASQIKSQFLANMSHELRTPLNAIIGFTRIVIRKAGDQLDERQRRNLELVLSSGQHLLEMVNDLLDIERIEAGMLRVNPSPVDCPQLAEEIISRFRPAADDKGLELAASADRVRIQTDPVRLRQVLDNLVANAIKYSERGKIELQIRRIADDIEFVIRDQGRGIPPQHLTTIFQPFVQLDGGYTRAEGGVGLGLHLVKRLAELLGGTVTASSEVETGSAFTLRLPGAIEVIARPVAERSPLPKGSGANILVIDDDLEAMEIIQTELADVGFRAHAAMSGAEGLELAKALAPDAIVLDIVMPGMDGWTVLKELRRDPDLAQIPVVIVSFLDHAPRASDFGIAAWLTKPVSSTELRAVLDRLGLRPRDEILVIEDDAPTRSLLGQQLSELDLRVVSASDGPSALARLAEEMPRAVILDLLLPGLDGFEVLQAIRKLPGGTDVPIIVYTGKDLSPEDVIRLNGGFVQVLQKQTADVGSVVEAVQRLFPVKP